MSVDHTVAPWSAEDRTGAGAGFSIVATAAHYSSAGVAHYVSARDAPLISAAPELLAVAKMCAELAERWGEQGSLVRAARAAIAKAEARP